MNLALSIIITYLWGAIPWSWIIARIAKGIDLRKEGSLNVGGTNVLRTCGKVAGGFAYVADGLKGFLPVIILPALLPVAFLHPTIYSGVIATMAIIGHMFTPYLGFKGGKGAMTGVGAVIAMAPWIGISALGVFGMVMIFTRIVSVGTMLTSASFPVLVVIFGLFRGEIDLYLLGFAVLTAALVISRHGSNLRRLKAGTEKPPLKGKKGKEAEKSEE
ncbi:glycerol-3-phosphate acyltransferase [bacterium]|nr:glycerol-3-phosphate acyltransferase [bacterium]